MKVNKLKSCNGITILESLVTVSLIVIISLVLMGLFIGHVRLSRMLSSNADLLNQRTSLEQEFERFVHLASRVESSATIGDTVYTTSAQVLVLEIPSISSEGFVISDQFDHVAYFLDPLDSSRIMLRFDPSSQSSRIAIKKLISDSVDNLNFSYDTAAPEDANLVTINIDLEKALFGNARIISLNTILFLRNK